MILTHPDLHQIREHKPQSVKFSSKMDKTFRGSNMATNTEKFESHVLAIFIWLYKYI